VPCCLTIAEDKEDLMATPERTGGVPASATPRRAAEPTGWVIFGAVMMFVIGSLDFFYGLAAVLNDTVVVVGGHGAIIADLTTWGWVTMILGVILVLVAFGLFVGSGAARWAAVFLLTVNAIEHVWIFPAAPLWAFIVILLSVIVIYNLCARWAEPV
jgi:hypothetical protein